MIENKAFLKENISKKATDVLVFHLFFLSCKNMLVSTIPAVEALNSRINLLAIVVLILLYMKLMLVDGGIKVFSGKSWLFLLAMTVFLIVSWLNNTKLFVYTVFPYNYVQSEFIKFLTYSLPMFCGMLLIKDFSCLKITLYNRSYILLLFASIGIIGTIMFPVNRADGVESYSMSYGNAVLLYTMISIFKFHDTHRLWTLVGGLVSIMYILIVGSRGPFVSIGVAVFYLFVVKAKLRKERIIAFILIVSGVLCVFYIDTILQVLIAGLNKLGLSSRTLTYANNRHLTYDSGRQVYFDIVYDALREHPILGLGAFGGEALVGLTHSLYVDIFANFGYLFGSVFIILVLYESIHNAFLYRNTDKELIIMLLFITCFPRGFFNDSYWTARELWMLLGIFLGNSSIETIEYKSKYLKSL